MFSDFLIKWYLSGKQSLCTRAINESIKAQLKAAASGEIENLQRPDLQRDIDSYSGSIWYMVCFGFLEDGPWVRWQYQETLPYCSGPLTDWLL